MADYSSHDFAQTPSIQISPSTPPTAPFQQAQSKNRWLLRGSCACCFVQYEISASPSELPFQACYCHCALCRNLSGSTSIAFTSIPSDRIRWFSGQWDWKTGRGRDITFDLACQREAYEFGGVPGFSTVADSIRLWSSSRKAVRGSCSMCGSCLFISYHSGVRTTDLALGTLWDDQERGRVLVKPVMHIMLREKALWDDVPDDGLQKFDGMPGEVGAGGMVTIVGRRKGKEPKRKTEDTRMAALKHMVECMMVY